MLQIYFFQYLTRVVRPFKDPSLKLVDSGKTGAADIESGPIPMDVDPPTQTVNANQQHPVLPAEPSGTQPFIKQEGHPTPSIIVELVDVRYKLTEVHRTNITIPKFTAVNKGVPRIDLQEVFAVLTMPELLTKKRKPFN